MFYFYFLVKVINFLNKNQVYIFLLINLAIRCGVGIKHVVITFGTCFKYISLKNRIKLGFIFIEVKHVIDIDGHCLLVVKC